MFTGIVAAKGILRGCEDLGSDRRFQIEIPAGQVGDHKQGDSMSVAGVCLTILEPNPNGFFADVSAETLSLTTLGSIQVGDTVNLEPAMKLADPLGGHLVTGHVDGLGELVSRRADGRAQRFRFSLPEGLQRYVARKGSVCIDGVSLTVNSVEDRNFTVCLIPHTLEVTTLGHLEPGDRVNIEVDLVARYVERLSQFGNLQ